MEIIPGVLDLPLWSALLAVASVLAYIYLTWTFDTWSKQGVKGSRPYPLFGNFIQIILSGGFANYDKSAIEKHGKVSGAFRGRTAILEVSDPEFLRLAFIKEFNCMPNRNDTMFGTIFDKMLTELTDDRWRHVRSSLTPTFTSGKLKEMVGRVNDCSHRFVEHLKAIEGQPFDSKLRIGAYTMDVISSTVFGIEIDSQAHPKHPMLENANNLMGINQGTGILSKIKTFWRNMLFLLLPQVVLQFLIKYTGAMFDGEALDYFVSVTDRIIAGRGSEDKKAKDFIQLCINKLVDNPKEGDPDTQVDKYGMLWTSKGLTKDEIIANAIVFYLAGYETTASTLNWLIYELTMNPEVQQRCVDEIEEAVGGKALDEPLTYDEVNKMEYLDWCIEESMRLYPAAPRIERMVEKECVIDGVKLPPGSYVSAMIYGMHHDPELWPEPEKFDPERFSPENKEGRHQCAWAPFGIGNRNCVGMRLALLEMKIVVATMLRNFMLEQCDETNQKPIKLSTNFRMDPDKPLKVKVSKRSRKVDS